MTNKRTSKDYDQSNKLTPDEPIVIWPWVCSAVIAWAVLAWVIVRGGVW